MSGRLRVLAAGLALLASACRAEVHAFHWETGRVGGLPERHLALLVPVTIGARVCDMQVDTGANRAVIWHAGEGGSGLPVTVRLGSLEASVEAGPEVAKAIEACVSGSPPGTLGNAFFERGTLVIDSVHQRLSYEPGSRLAGRPQARPFTYAVWGKPGGHILVEVGAKPFGKGQAMLDTGAVLAEFGVLDERSWKGLMGSGEDGVTRVRINAWGKQIECRVGAGGNPVALDGFALTAREVVYCPALPFRAPVPLAGIVGMPLFRSSILTIDYPARLWLVEDVR